MYIWHLIYTWHLYLAFTFGIYTCEKTSQNLQPESQSNPLLEILKKKQGAISAGVRGYLETIQMTQQQLSWPVSGSNRLEFGLHLAKAAVSRPVKSNVTQP